MAVRDPEGFLGDVVIPSEARNLLFLRRNPMFCPECISNAALTVTGVVSTGGAGALLARLLRAKSFFRKFPKLFRSKEKSS